MYRLPNIDSETKSHLIKISCGILAIGITGHILHNYYRKHVNGVILKKKQDELKTKKNNLFNKLKNLKTPFDNIDTITKLNLKDLIDGISSGKYAPIDILQAYQAKALLMDREYNFITDINPNIEEDLFNSDIVKHGTLKGIPVSVKECFMIKGFDCTWGMLDQLYSPSDGDEIIVKNLRLQGWIPSVTTNLPQAAFSIDSSNPIYGETLNPYNKNRTSGGSSGGEGAILGCGASIIGIGNDIGGSVRIPCSYCGIFGLKPTVNRISSRNCHRKFLKPNILDLMVGPMARSIDDLVTFFKCLVSEDSYRIDPYSPPLLFNDEVFENKKPLKIGFYTHIGGDQVTPVPAVVRAVGLAKAALQRAGHTVVPFKIPDIDHAIFNLYFPSIFSDGGVELVDYIIKDNPVVQSQVSLVSLFKIPKFIKRIMSYIMWPFDKNHSRVLYACCGAASIYKVWQLKADIDQYRELVLTQLQQQHIDGLICPIFPIAAPPLGMTGCINDMLGYTAVYNLLDYPAGSVPVTRVSQNDIDEMMKTYPRNTSAHRQMIEYQKESIGMPIGVQSVSLPWQEEVCLRIMRDINDNMAA